MHTCKTYVVLWIYYMIEVILADKLITEPIVLIKAAVLLIATGCVLL